MSAFSSPTFAVVPALQRNIIHYQEVKLILFASTIIYNLQQFPSSSVFHLVLEETLLTVLAF